MTEVPSRAHDPVNHPTHYTSHPSLVEVIQITRLLPFGPGNAVKYVLRAGHKNQIEDLDKALWYLTDSAEHNISYAVTPEMEALARRVIAHEPDRSVVSFLTALCLPGANLYGHRNKTRTNFLSARHPVLRMRDAYREERG